MEKDSLALGTRILVGGHKGTVLYVGHINSDSTCIWVGVEWDDLGRGKHSGDFEGVQYFKPRRQFSSTFVSLTSLLKNLQRGISFYEAVEDKYSEILDKVSVMSFRQTKLQYNDCSEVQTVNISWKHRIVELDLSDTLISDLSVVDSIIEQLPNLTRLFLDKNRMCFVSSQKYKYHRNIRFLSLNETGITLQMFFSYARQFPNLREISLCKNDFTKIDINESLEYITKLDLSENKITTLHNLEVVFPSLKELCLNGNLITSISKETSKIFPYVETLFINENRIDLDRSDFKYHFPNLKRLSVRDGHNTNISDIRYASIVSNLQGLQCLNGIIIDNDLRKELDLACRNYLDPVKMKTFEKAINQDITIKVYALPNNIIRLNLLYRGVYYKIQPVPESISFVQMLDMLSARYNLPTNVSIYIMYRETPHTRVKINNLYKEMSFYNVGTGDSICIE